MHEQSIVESLLAIAIENAEKASASRILRINLVVGELSGIVEESVGFYFSFLSEDTIAANASISYNRIPAKLHCRKCDKIFVAENLDFRCPQCQEQQLEIVGGRELYIESIEVE
jgi:hydrogenase nickel incorporation protein HypA/HybF